MVKISQSSGNVGLREFRENTAKYISQLEQGKKFTIYRHAKPVFAVVPADAIEFDAEDEKGWETLDLRDAKHPNGIPAEEMIAIIDRIYGRRRKIHKKTR